MITLDFPDWSVWIGNREPVFDISKADFCNRLASLLPDDKEKYSNVGIIVSDKTRLCGYPLYLPWVAETLIKKGARKNAITFYIAYGTHPKQSEEESLQSYGGTYKEFRFVHHDCYDDAAMINLGRTTRGTDALIRGDVLQSSLLLTFGAISHHYFAGYGGGRKLLFPGLAARKSIYQNHSLFLDRKGRCLEKYCQPGQLENNPLAEDLLEIDKLTPPKISIHGILNSKGEVCKLLTGIDYNDFLTACREHDSYYRSGNDQKFDLVIASGGGYPKDINFIQAHKAVHHAAAFVKDGGRLIMLSECIDGIASNYFLKFLEAGGFENAYAMLEENYEGNGGTALSMMTKTQRINIFMLTSLDENLCKLLGVVKINESEMQQLVLNEKGSMAVIRNASMVIR